MDWTNFKPLKDSIIQTKKDSFWRSHKRLVIVFVLILVVLAVLSIYPYPLPVAGLKQSIEPPLIKILPAALKPGSNQLYTKADLKKLITIKSFEENGHETRIVKDNLGRTLYLSTNIDPKLQTWAEDFAARNRAYITALVALDPVSGQVYAIAGQRENKKSVEMALAGFFPAASLFKIVSAAAALEAKSLTGDTAIYYDGGKHTLYKRQLKTGLQTGRNRSTLKAGFAKSINPVFGKLGAYIGPESISAFAYRFRFNRAIPFELPVKKSRFKEPTSDSYNLAEIASGFNRTTLISPLHAALLAGTVSNHGRLMEPGLVKEVFDKDNNVYYRHEPTVMGWVISEETAAQLREMMIYAVAKGTGRKTFRDRKRHRVLKKLDIGGKTGNINDSEGRKVDWFISFAEHRETGKKIAIAGVVVHNTDFLGHRAIKMVRQGIINYFKPSRKKDG